MYGASINVRRVRTFVEHLRERFVAAAAKTLKPVYFEKWQNIW